MVDGKLEWPNTTLNRTLGDKAGQRRLASRSAALRTTRTFRSATRFCQ